MNTTLLNYSTLQANSCYTGSVWNILRNLNVEIDESEIFFLGRMLNCIYSKGNGCFTSGHLNTAVFEQYTGINFIEIDNFEIPIIESCLHQYGPIIVELKSNYLEYHPVFKRNKGRKHFIVIYGIDRKLDLFHVSDSYVIDVSATTYHGGTPIDSIMRAKKAIHGKCYCLDLSSYNKDCIKTINWHEIVRSNLQQYLYAESNNEGMHAISLFYDALEKTKDVTRHDLSIYCSDLVFQLKMYGFMLGRLFLKQLIVEHLITIIDPDVLITLDTMYNKWHNICMQLLLLSLRRNIKYSNKVIQQFQCCILEEKQVFEYILRQMNHLQ